MRVRRSRHNFGHMRIGFLMDPLEDVRVDHDSTFALMLECQRRGLEVLEAFGLWFVGIDVLGGKLTEVNVTSPTGLVEIDTLTGQSLEARVIDFALARAALPGRAAGGI